MTTNTFYEKFVPDFKLDVKGLVDYISTMESEIYEKK